MYWLFPDDEKYQSLPMVSMVEQELTYAGFVNPVPPSDSAQRNAAKHFATVLGSLDLSQYRLDDRRLTEFEIKFPGFAAPTGWETLLDYVADWKLEPDYLIKLIKQRLAVQNGPRLWMHSALAHAYLLVLGMELANEYGASPVSDEEVYHSAGGQDVRALVTTCLGDATAAPSTEPGQYEAILINLAVATVLPRDLDAVQPEQIIHFRQEYAGERIRFARKSKNCCEKQGSWIAYETRTCSSTTCRWLRRRTQASSHGSPESSSW